MPPASASEFSYATLLGSMAAGLPCHCPAAAARGAAAGAQFAARAPCGSGPAAVLWPDAETSAALQKPSHVAAAAGLAPACGAPALLRQTRLPAPYLAPRVPLQDCKALAKPKLVGMLVVLPYIIWHERAFQLCYDCPNQTRLSWTPVATDLLDDCMKSHNWHHTGFRDPIVQG